MSLQKVTLTALSLVAAGCIGFAFAPMLAGAESAALDKAQVEKIVHDYIMNNPKVLLESVNGYQQKEMEDRMAKSSEDLKKNKDQLVNDSFSPVAGNPSGDVTIVEFFDYNCGYCKRAFAELQEVLNKDKNIRVVFKEFPILGPSSETAAKWALAASKQKKYFEFHKALMENKSPIDETLLEKLAQGAGMDVAQAKKDIDSPEVAQEIEKNRALASQLYISGTPAFVIGDDISRGAIPLAEMEKKISAARKK
jgi:protein-disulfide isomerase